MTVTHNPEQAVKRIFDKSTRRENRNDLPAALALLVEAEELIKQHFGLENQTPHRLHGVLHLHLANLHYKMDDHRAAREAALKGLEVINQVSSDPPHDSLWQSLMMFLPQH
jgi:hypothetical protein